MFKPSVLPSAVRTQHLTLLSERFFEALYMKLDEFEVSGEAYDRDLVDLLLDILDDILIGDPQELEMVALAVEGLFPQFVQYVRRKRKGDASADATHRNTLSLIEACFDYGEFSSKRDSWNAYELVRSHDLRICPYCHAHHVNYYVDAAAARAKKKYLMRPPLDHFYPKSIYPYLAVSLGNLVPSCNQCNSTVKSVIDPLTEGLPSPLDQTSVLHITFSASGSIPTIVKGTAEDVRLSLVATDDPSKAHVSLFQLELRYQWYRREIKDLIERHYDWQQNVPASLRRPMSQELYVLGFRKALAPSRAIGLCLRDVFDQLVVGKVV